MNKNKFKLDRPRVLVYPVTYRCNSRCKMCNIWDLDPGPEISAADLNNVLNDKFLSHSIEFINITGGECFLRKDICELIELFVKKCPNLITVGFASNGFATKTILRAIDRLIAITLPSNIYLSIGLSFDGLEHVHDDVRGVAGGFSRMIETLKKLRQLEKIYWPKFAVGVGTNINAITIDHLDLTYKYFTENNIRASFTPVVTSDLYFQNVDNNDTFGLTSDMREKAYRFFCKLKKEKYIDNFYFKFAKGWLLEGKRSVGCIFQTSGIFLAPNGDLYPCMMFQEFKMGNLLETRFSDIWQQNRLDSIYQELSNHCPNCGSDCFIEKASIKNRIKRTLYYTLFR